MTEQSGRPVLIALLVGLLLIGGGIVVAGRYYRAITVASPDGGTPK